MRRKLKGKPEVADFIIPENFAVGCRRPTPGDGFLEALIEPNVTIHTNQMQRVTEKGFIAHDGTIVKIITRTQPFDMTPLSSDETVRGVIEINGGKADRDNIKIGDKIILPQYFGAP